MIHPLSDVQTDKIGKGTRIWQFCVILPDVEIGENCNINANVLVETGVKIGNNVTLKSGVQLWDGVVVEDDVFIGPNATFANDPTPRSGDHLATHPITRICKRASIGANATILCGVTIGENALIGAGSVVTHDVPANTVWFGNPARQRGIIDKEDNITYNQSLNPIGGGKNISFKCMLSSIINDRRVA